MTYACSLERKPATALRDEFPDTYRVYQKGRIVRFGVRPAVPEGEPGWQSDGYHITLEKMVVLCTSRWPSQSLAKWLFLPAFIMWVPIER